MLYTGPTTQWVAVGSSTVDTVIEEEKTKADAEITVDTVVGEEKTKAGAKAIVDAVVEEEKRQGVHTQDMR